MIETTPAEWQRPERQIAPVAIGGAMHHAGQDRRGSPHKAAH